MTYHFRIYYPFKDWGVINKVKEKFHTTVTVNYESYITTDEEGYRLLVESERRGLIQIRGISKNRN